MPAAPADPVLERRRRIAALVQVGKRIGYALFAAAVAVFFAGLAAGYTTTLTAIVVTCLLVGSAVLAPAIVFGYAVKAAEREDRERREAGRLTGRSRGEQDAP